MIHYNDDNTIEMEGTGADVLAETGIIIVHVIQMMIKNGMQKSDAITQIYKAIEHSIKVYESFGEL